MCCIFFQHGSGKSAQPTVRWVVEARDQRLQAGYENLSKDFNVFLVGDISLATFPSNTSPRFDVNAAISFAALKQNLAQVSWVNLDGK